MKEEFLSISEFAERAGVSVQYVHKIFSTKLKEFSRVEKGKKYINIKALSLFSKTESLNQNFNQVETQEPLLRTISMLEKELDIKNEQIRTLNAQTTQQLQLIDQQQKLQAIAETKRVELPAERKSENLLNREKFSTEAEYQQCLLMLIPRITLFSNRQDKQKLERILEMMSEYERSLVYRNKNTREAIEHIKGVDFDKLERAMAEAERESEEMKNKWFEAMEKMRVEQEKKRAEAEAQSSVDRDNLGE